MEKAVLTVDRDGIITSVNPACLTLIGVGPGSTGRKLAEASHRTPVAELAEHVLRSRRSVSDHDYTVDSGSRSARLRADCQLIKDGDGNTQGAAVYVKDVTERSLLEERMRRMERYMGLGSLAAGLHHEIKNPLGALSLHVQLLEEKLAVDAPEGAAEHLQVLKTEVTRIGGVLESFRDFASSTKLHLQSTDLCALVGRAVRLIQPQAAQHGIVLNSDIPDDTSIVVEADAARLEQVVLNLLLNSTEAMPSGGRVTIRLFADEGYVRMEVADTGSGIPESIRSRVFDPYFTTKPNGSGMGLALCQKIVQQHGGTINCDTSPDGTVFSLSIPRVATSDVNSTTIEP
jgi:PAS domain S-box-containing protein